MGPLEMADLVGLDTRLYLLEELYKSLGEKFRPCPLLRQYVKAGRLGRKSGQGVYKYPKPGNTGRTSPAELHLDRSTAPAGESD
jgi:3-hydroxybutyryl-CoA dehydrogenase